MTDAQTFFEFRLACHKPGCPICTLIQRVGTQYIEGIYSESLLDPNIRLKLVDSLGLCYEHTWRSIDLKLSDALGHAILFKDLIKDVLNKLKRFELKTGAQLTDGMDAVASCPVCRIEHETEERVIDSIKSALRTQDFLADFSQSSGICVPHLKPLLRNLDAKQRAIIVEHQYLCLERLQGELAEFIRKSDYRFRDELMGEEGDSYKRAADIMIGKHRPVEKKEMR
jgi:hypothetical protein